MSRQNSDWIPSLRSFEDFQRMALQLLDGFMIILSTDGVIIFVGENVSSLLGYSPDEIVGKKLLSLLPDKEKRGICGKITIKLPASNLVGKHTNFCCHLRRGDIKPEGPTYEYVKFLMSIKDFLNEPLTLLNNFLPSQSWAESLVKQLPLEDRFYMVGTVCVLTAQTLRELFGMREPDDNIVLIEDSDDEGTSVDYR
ncbi:circadian clock protein PASD1 [Pteropus medius]|uniref:circadian clock protein PASD1 n=1 Tax=Pteropus vampyrus TaxID=132908 RepID=UPI00196AAE0A|nr:circadian clock protein PASD1 [Pteropus giganteus]